MSSAAACDLVDVPQRGDARGIRVTHRAAAVPLARREFLSDIVPRLASDVSSATDVSSEAAVVVSELLGNAVRHARDVDGQVMLRWQVRGGTVDIEVTDGGGRSEVRPLRPATYSTSGRGLRIVRSFAHEWGVTEAPDGRRTVWAAVGGPTKRRHRTP